MGNPNLVAVDSPTETCLCECVLSTVPVTGSQVLKLPIPVLSLRLVDSRVILEATSGTTEES